MLCLTRLGGEWIDITLPDGRLVSVVVIEGDRQRVRLGFVADADIAIDRREVREAKEASCANQG